MFSAPRPWLLVSALFLAACDGSGAEDAGVAADASARPDLGSLDARSDAGRSDLGATDLGLGDTVGPDIRDFDLGAGDLSTPDGSPLDAGPADSGLDFCTPNPCFDGVLCTNTSTTYRCGSCPVGLIGDGINCEEHDECLSAPCLPGTSCTDVPAPGAGFLCSPCVGVSCPILRAQAGPDQRLVLGAVATLGGSATGFNGAFSCEWSNDADAVVLSTCTATVSPTLDTTYTLTVTDASGLSASDQMVIRIVGLIADAGPDLNIVSTATAALTAAWSGASCGDSSCIGCEWRLSNGSLVATTCDAFVSPAATTVYFLTVTDSGSNQSAQDSATVFGTDQPAQLCGWDVVVMTSNEYPTSPNPNYICDANGTARRQTINGKPAIVVSDLVVSNARITGFISVETTADDDHVGFLWGWENPKHAYLLSWKRAAQNWTAACGNAPRGIAVKKIDGAAAAPETISFNSTFGYNATDYVYSCADAWSQDRANATLLGDDSVFLIAPADSGAYTGGWAALTTYRFEFYYTPDRTKIFIYEDDAMTGSTANLITTLLVEDSSYPAGGFAFFSNSQEQVQFGDFTLASLNDYAADAGPDQVMSPGGSVVLSGSAAHAVPPYACVWTDGGGVVVSSACEATVSPSGTTTYQLTVTDDFQRVAGDSVVVTVAGN